MTSQFDEGEPSAACPRTRSEPQRVRELLTLSRDIALALSSTTNLSDGMQQLASLCRGVCCLDAAGVYVVDREVQELRLIAHSGLSDAFIAHTSHYHFGSSQATIVLAGEPLYARHTDVFRTAPPVMAREGLLGLGVVPINDGERVIGSLNVATRSAETIPQVTRIAIETIAAQIGGAMARLVAEEHRALLVRELDHRVRNNLAMVEALAGQALNRTDSIHRFRATFGGRIAAMARIHEALATGSWTNLAVRTLLSKALAPLAGPQLSLEGDRVCLAERAATPLCLVFHELGTNALAHGALSVPEGRVHLRWVLEESGLTFEWSETEGPTIAAEAVPGTGTAILRALVENQLHGELVLDFDPSGLHCRIRLPTSIVATSAS